MDDTQLLAELTKAGSNKELFQAVVDAPFKDVVSAAELFLGIVVLLILNKDTGMIDRVALSRTHLAEGTKKMSVKKFEDIKIPADYMGNIIVEAIHTGKPTSTIDWRYLFEPALTAQEARFNQAGGAISYSAVYPLVGVKDGAAMIFSYYQYPEHIGVEQRKFMKRYSRLVASHLQSVL